MRTLRFFLLIAVLGTLCAGQLIAQGTSGSITGRTTDSSGKVLPNVAITLTNLATSQKKSTTSNSSGLYNFPDLLPGNYSLHAQLKGFQTVNVPSLTVQVNEAVQNNFAMAVGSVSTTVTVAATTPLLQTQTSSTGQVITGKRILEMPLNGRNVFDLVLLVPGASENPGAQSQFSINGQRGNETSMLVNGVDTRMFQNGKPAFTPSVDAVQEFKVQENSTSAAFGDGTAVVNVALRSGTNQFHGDLWEFVRNDALAARGYFDKAKLPLVRNQYGLTLGGPIQKNRTFFFVYYEGLGTHSSTTQFAQVPTPAELEGNFADDPQIYNPFDIDPVTHQRLPFSSNQIPSALVSPFAQAAAKLYPKPVDTGVPGFNYVNSVDDSESANQVSLRIDHEFSQNDSLNGTVIWAKDRSTDGSVLPLTGNATTVNGTQIALHETHVFAPSLINQFTAGYTYGRNALTPSQLASTPLATEAFGLKNLKIPPANQGMPQLSFGFQVLSGNGGSGAPVTTMGTPVNRPFGGNEDQYLLQDNVSWTHDLHHFEFGGEVRQHRPRIYDQGTPNGNLSFDGQFTNQIGVNSTVSNSIADFVLGLPYTATATQLGESVGFVSLRWSQFALFLEDNYHILPKLTLNLGIRYEYSQPWREVNDAAQVWSPGQNTFLKPGDGINGLVKPDRNNFAPRLGFAYSVTPLTVLRGGFGVFYGFPRGLELSSGYHLDPPYNVSVTVNSNPVTPTILPGTLFPLATKVPTPTTSLFSVNHNFPANYTYEYNLMLQRQITPSLSLQVGYVGSSSHKLTGRTLINQAHLDADPSHPTSIQSRRPFSGAADISITNSIDQANYNALQVTLEKRYSHGLSLLAAYGWAKALGISEGGDQSSIGNEYGPRHRYYGPLPYNQPQRLAISAMYDLPFGQGKLVGANLGSVANLLVGGWQTGGIGTFFKGESTSVNSNVSPNVGRVDRNFPDCVGNATLSSGRSIQHWFNTAAFVPQPFGTFGDCPAGNVEIPGENNIDFGLIKNTRFHDRYNVQLRGEFFNFFNHPSFGPPNVSLGSKSFGVVSSTRTAGRIIQLAAKFYW